MWTSALIRLPIHVLQLNTYWDRVGPIFMGLNSEHSIFVRMENATRVARAMRTYYMGSGVNQKLRWPTRHQFTYVINYYYL